MSGIAWLAQQLETAASNAPEPGPPRFNPRPPGVIQDGGAASALLAFLQANPGRYYTSIELIVATRHTHSAVSWGLFFLRQLDLIDTGPDPRNKRYMRYRLTPDAKATN